MLNMASNITETLVDFHSFLFFVVFPMGVSKYGVYPKIVLLGKLNTKQWDFVFFLNFQTPKVSETHEMPIVDG